MGHPHVGRVVREAEDPRRGGEQRAGGDVDQVVHGHRGDLPEAELVVREQAVGDQPDAEHDRHDRRGGVLGELEDPRCGDERGADDVVERRVELRRDEAHRDSFRDVLGSRLIRTAGCFGSSRRQC